MKLVYRVCLVSLTLLSMVFVAMAQTPAPTPRSTQTITNKSDARSAKDPRNTAPTVGTGGPVGGPTGLFTVYDGQVLRRGEFTFSAAYSNFDRDPGNADIVEVPLSFQVGLTNRLELFFSTDAYRAIKINSPGNLSSFGLPNSQYSFNKGIVTSGPAIVLGPGTAGPYSNRAVYRPTGTAPFVQFPFVGGSAGNYGLSVGTSGPLFGFPVGTTASLGPIRVGGKGADNFPGIGSVYGSILPGVVLQTACTSGGTSCSPAATVPTIFTTQPSYLNDAPFINRQYGESSFNSYTAGLKWRWTGLDNPVGAGIVAYYKWYADNNWYSDNSFEGFNQLQRGSSPGGQRGDVGVALFADARLRKWMNLSANVGYQWNSSVKFEMGGDTFTLLDRGDELMASVGVDFPVNKYFQPIAEFRSLRYIGGRTPNAFENNPMDGIAGVRIFPARWFGFGFAYRYHFNQQDRESFNEDDQFTSGVFVPCFDQGGAGGGEGGCTPRTIATNFSGVPNGFRTSNDPHGFIIQAFAGRRNKRAEEVVNQFANVTALTLSDTEIKLPCKPGYVPTEGQACADNTQISIQTSASDPENDVLTYNYTVSGGRIVGTGANVTWDVSGLAPGTYTITAGVDDGCGLCGKTETKTITIADCECKLACECPTISVTGPAGITNPGDTMTFTANVSGGSQASITYNWSVTGGTIESGQGTPSITVRTTREEANSNLTATVDIGGTDPSCNCTTTASETAPVAGLPEAVLINEFGKMSNDDVRAQLDIFFGELANNPNNQGYIINYGTDREIAARERLITNHIAFRKFDRSRITLVRGGTSPDGVVHTKFYRVPPGAENPMP